LWRCHRGSEGADVLDHAQLQQSHETLREDQGMLGQGVATIILNTCPLFRFSVEETASEKSRDPSIHCMRYALCCSRPILRVVDISYCWQCRRASCCSRPRFSGILQTRRNGKVVCAYIRMRARTHVLPARASDSCVNMPFAWVCQEARDDSRKNPCTSL